MRIRLKIIVHSNLRNECCLQIYILYPEAVELAGTAEVHGMVSDWPSLESVLTVRHPTAQGSG